MRRGCLRVGARLKIFGLLEGVPVWFQIKPEIMQLGEMFSNAGFELSLVGGAVRDLLLSRPVHDYDFATSATVEQSEPILRAWGKD
ncbi:MAG: CCA tRNA nucleotidyltransferase, partial [Aeriscardovia sp.]|nr:CCA tRNA nucleotidyltransferase [Aeriscardovia sp.]